MYHFTSEKKTIIHMLKEKALASMLIFLSFLGGRGRGGGAGGGSGGGGGGGVCVCVCVCV